MKLLTGMDLAEAYAKVTQKWVLYLALPVESPLRDDFDPKLYQASTPYLQDSSRYRQCMVDGLGYVVCDTEKEARRLFMTTAGDDNAQDKMYHTYALLISPTEGAVDENT